MKKEKLLKILEDHTFSILDFYGDLDSVEHIQTIGNVLKFADFLSIVHREELTKKRPEDFYKEIFKTAATRAKGSGVPQEALDHCENVYVELQVSVRNN